MSSSTPNTIVSNTTSQPLSRRSDLDSMQPTGLRIEGLPSPFCASADADHNSLRLSHVQENDSESMQSINKDDYPHKMQNRSSSSYTKYLAVSILSTLLSLAYVVIAVWGPTWDTIRDPSISKNVTSIVAKIIEASFGSICVLFVGQLLTRRSTSEDTHHGVSLYQICMRDWIIDPASMFSDDKVLWLGMRSFLGWYVLVASVAALLYGTASQNLVQPVVRDTSGRRSTLNGLVTTSFGDEVFIERKYRSSLVPDPSVITDRSYMSVVYSARCSDSWNSYLSAWNGITNQKTIQSQRFVPWTIDRSTQGQINGSWVQDIDMIDVSKKFDGRIVNNVTLAIPHPGISKAASDKSNLIAQPNEFEGGVGRYQIRAQIPSPYLNIICTNAKRSDLEGLVHEDQIEGQLNNSDLLIPDKDPQFVIDFDWEKYTTVKSPLDNIFNWNNSNNKRPIFYRYPPANQTVRTIGSLEYDSFGRNSVYLLSAPGDLSKDNSTQEYTLCSIQAGLLVNCFTELSVAGNSSVMTAHCDDSSNSMAYSRRDSSAKDTVRPAFVAVGSLAATSVGLNNGELGNPADNMNYLTKLILKNATLRSDRPSIAEGLAAFLLPSLVMAAQDSPFDTSTTPASSTESLQSFPIILTATLYASGGKKWYQHFYVIVLAVVFLMNSYMLYYLFLRHRKDLKMDICDSMNLFGLAVASDFNNFPDSKLILSPKKENSERLRSIEWKISCDPNKKMEIVQVSPACKSGGSPNGTMHSSGFTPLLATKRWSGGKAGEEENIEMV
ncbi:hypothetical protein EG328_012087 [Venturia inaequalis]|uniref:Uncharacterized protein n=1 Tax=Venturia inaequalis TaxID=5025 RepID=A0A8H3Z4W2_VENIN|nr:hypothetical protein EG328_012087 [Venturia inaequalis]